MPAQHIKLTILIKEESDGWFIATCPVLPGCVSQGRSQKEAVKNIHEAIIGWLLAKDETAASAAKRASGKSKKLQALAITF